ncbi:uncharacterized protein HHUB_6057 (plasmid) [Halobacterium hubeiense]|uniref:Uncharacterized protein n=1 Tax=Halobacterium hubeiense TaxID=1407499 RepID=A0A0U5HC44_9EURY|nr:hypothetical protein [Halobacterium hubeiense]CQH65084.1 uncharacterized protein HHUB_6057 [Halobacterium hubeiense]
MLSSPFNAESPETDESTAKTTDPKEGRSSSVSGSALRVGVQALAWAAILIVLVESVTAANGMTLSKQPRETLAVPRWLYLATGGATIGASALLASFVTDRAFIYALHSWSVQLPGVPAIRRGASRLGQLLALATLGLMVYVGYSGPQLPAASLTVLVTFVGIRGGLPVVAYLIGNPWPAINPWRALTTFLPEGFIEYPDSFARWPAVVGVLALVWVEVIFPVSTVPRVLASAILGYSLCTVTGAIVFGSDAWFKHADPLAVLFRCYGTVAPIQIVDGSLEVSLPGNNLADSAIVTDESDVAFIIALVWELTYSGFITTTAGAQTISAVVESPLGAVLPTVPMAILVYTVLFLAGYVLFLTAYWYAGKAARRLTNTYVTSRSIALRLAPPLLAIAAGYHLAHYANLVVSLSPALAIAAVSPLTPPANPLVLAPPGWFTGLSVAFVLIGHLLAIWEAHAAAYDLFPSRLVAIRSQYPFIVVMIGYTVISLWILSLAGATPPYLG